jgi:NitT/TauT family transport system ATP-binding protein
VSALEVAGASKIFNQGTTKQVDALIDVNLTVNPGEFVSLIGPSGCGKSTLLRLIANLLEPTSGSVSVNNKTAAQARLDQDYGMAFQQAGLFDWRTVSKNIELPLELKGWDKAKREARAKEMLELVKLPEFADLYPWQLSGGMQQRIAIARALAAHPPLLLMDEPFGALDEMTRDLSNRVVVMSPRPGRITEVIDVDLGAKRNEDTRAADGFFKSITAVREALRGTHADHAAANAIRGVEDR